MKPLIQIFNFSLTNQKDGEYDVHVDGDIVDAPTQELMKAFWGDETSVSFRSFRNQIDAASPKILNVYVNSGGGHVGDAMAMHDYLSLLESKGTKVNRIGIGIVASAATYLVMGNNSEMSENSFMMIHNVSMLAYGDINQVENQARAGRKFNDTIRDFYANHTGNPPETISAWMNKETWMNAKEAKERGFIKNISASATFTNAISADKWPFSDKAILNAYNSFTTNSSDMKIDLTTLKEAVKNALKDLGFSKPEDDGKLNIATDAITNALSAQLKPLENISETINTAVAAAVANAAKDALTTEQVSKLITDRMNDVVKKTDLTNLENSIAEKLGKPADEKDPLENSGPTKIKNKKDFYRRGEFGAN